MAIDVSSVVFDINSEPIEVLQFKQHDNLSRIILLELTDDGAPLDLNGCDAILYAKKSDGTQVFQSCELLDAQYGQLKIVLKQQVLSCVGEVLCEVVITGADRVLTTRTFKIDVLPCIRDESAIESADDFTDLQVMLNGYATANKTAAIFESAYEAFTESGGTESFDEWLATFKGEKGDKGDDGKRYYVHVRYADSDSPISSDYVYADPDGHSYFGIYTGTSSEAPAHPANYVWASFKGEKGDKGDKGDKGPIGSDGLTPHIGDNYNWYVGSQDTGVDARGLKGDPGIILVEYANRTAYETALSNGDVAENEISFWGQ